MPNIFFKTSVRCNPIPVWWRIKSAALQRTFEAIWASRTCSWRCWNKNLSRLGWDGPLKGGAFHPSIYIIIEEHWLTWFFLQLLTLDNKFTSSLKFPSHVPSTQLGVEICTDHVQHWLQASPPKNQSLQNSAWYDSMYIISNITYIILYTNMNLYKYICICIEYMNCSISSL